MSKLQYLALSGVFAVAAAIATQGQAQTRPAVADRSVVADRGVVSVRPGTVTPGPALRPIRPDARPERRREHERPDHLQQRLRNACFNSPNPPVEICRRYFGNQ